MMINPRVQTAPNSKVHPAQFLKGLKIGGGKDLSSLKSIKLQAVKPPLENKIISFPQGTAQVNQPLFNDVGKRSQTLDELNQPSSNYRKINWQGIKIYRPPTDTIHMHKGHVRGKEPLVTYDKVLPKPSVVQVPTTFHSSRKGQQIDSIVLHDTASSNKPAEKMAKFFTKPHKRRRKDGTLKTVRVSTHYVIDKEGKIAQVVPDDRSAWHTGKINRSSIGIDFVNRGWRKVKRNGKKYYAYDAYTAKQYEATAKLIAHLVTKHGIPLENLVGHRHLSNNRGDPSANFDWERLLNMVDHLIK